MLRTTMFGSIASRPTKGGSRPEDRSAPFFNPITRIARLDQNYFIFRAGWPGIESWKVMRSIELMGKYVLPYFHKKYGRG